MKMLRKMGDVLFSQNSLSYSHSNRAQRHIVLKLHCSISLDTASMISASSINPDRVTFV